MLKLDKMPPVSLKNIEDAASSFKKGDLVSTRLEDAFLSNAVLYGDSVRLAYRLTANEDSNLLRKVMETYSAFYGALQLALEDREDKKWTRFEFPRVGWRAIAFAADAVNMREYGSSSEFSSIETLARDKVVKYLHGQGFANFIVPSEVPQNLESGNEHL